MIETVCIVFLPLRPGMVERFVHRPQGAEISTKRGTNSVSIFFRKQVYKCTLSTVVIVNFDDNYSSWSEDAGGSTGSYGNCGYSLK